jgi:RNA polymerase sigma-70 factor (ECF subfamily)
LSLQRLDDQFFRREFSRLVAALSRRVGARNLEAVEDAAQAALVAALETWTVSGLPDSPPAWLSQVAQNHLTDDLRRRARQGSLLERYGPGPAEDEPAAPPVSLSGDVPDDLLRMLFVCCDESIPVESQIVLALRTLGGFDVREIAERLFTTEANVYKRLARARSRLRELPLEVDDLSTTQLSSRLPAVQSIVYVMFTEGYLSSREGSAIVYELCEEARRLAAVLAEHPVSATPETFALLALMHLHGARSAARQDASGGLLLLEEQDRSRWDPRQIETGLAWLERSAEGDVFSRYHAEAAIAAEHCLAPSFAETRWDRIAETYALLERLAPSPLHTLNRAVAIAEWRGPHAGLAILEGLAPPSWLAGSYLWSAVLADLHRRCDHHDIARRHRETALALAPSSAVRDLIERRLSRCDQAPKDAAPEE